MSCNKSVAVFQSNLETVDDQNTRPNTSTNKGSILQEPAFYDISCSNSESLEAKAINFNVLQSKQVEPLGLFIKENEYGICGLFARKAIKKGHLIIEETPILQLECSEFTSSDLAGAYLNELCNLCKSNRDIYSSLKQNISGNGPNNAGLETFNRLKIPHDDTGAVKGIFFVASKLNHSCSPNVEQCWNSSSSSCRFVACRDIAEGEELTIAYIDIFQSHKKRNELLKQEYGFQCSCPVCLSSFVQKKTSDRRRQTIKKIDKHISRAIEEGNFGASVLLVHQIFNLLSEGDISAFKYYLRCEYDAFRSCLEIGDVSKAEEFFHLACKHCEQLFGLGSEELDSLLVQRKDLEVHRLIYDVVHN